MRLALPTFTLPTVTAQVDWAVGIPLLVGYYLSQWLHLVADGVRPDHKMRFRRR